MKCSPDERKKEIRGCIHRVVDERKVDALVRQLDNLLMKPVVVSYRDGKYYLIDGQHRIAALRKMFKDTDTIIP